MTGAFTLAGWHFSRNPTSSSSENRVAQAIDSEPWKTGSDAKYQYHPHGDMSRGRKDAPSALNEVIIPNVNLPKVGSLMSLLCVGRQSGKARGSENLRKSRRQWERCAFEGCPEDTT